ncbi:MAG TPA: class I SAM-dependent methyltransferase [Acidimicrobiales bacterium]|nr:class I SAM-dependent methyltransferase [Acidimicrobiales bacterium]
MDFVQVFGRAAADYDSVIPFFRTFGERLVDYVDVQPGDDVLDLASGRGATVFPALARGAGVVATDLAPEMVEALRADGVDARLMDAQEPEGNADYDVVLCAFSVGFLPDRATAFANWRRVLRNGGRVGLSVPTGANDEMMFFGDVAKQFVAMPPPFPPGDIRAELTAAGFTGVEEHDDEALFVFPDEEAWWRWVNSQGQRAAIERVPADRLDAFKEACFERLRPSRQPDGYHLVQRARYTRCQSFHTGS